MRRINIYVMAMILVALFIVPSSFVLAQQSGWWTRDSVNSRVYLYNNNFKVGIGKTNPGVPLEVYSSSTSSSNLLRVGNAVDAAGEVAGIQFSPGSGYYAEIYGVRLSGTYSPSALAFSVHKDNQQVNIEAMRIDYTGNVGIGVPNPASRLGVNGGISAGSYSTTAAPSNGMIISGSVGIGTPNPQAKLDVAGGIRADSIVINNGGADFVFDENYDLQSLEKIEQFIKDNKHLPDIQTAEQMQKEGVSVGKMQTKLLQKIEELTLYAIEQNKRIQKLEEELSKK
jgi:hypothetical protein